MAIGFRAASAANNAGGSASVTGSAPAGTIATDLLIAFVYWDGATAATVSTPSGWTVIDTDNTGTIAGETFWALGSVSAFTWNFSAGSPVNGVTILGYTGVLLGSPIAAHSINQNTSSPIATTAITVPGGGWFVAGFADYEGSGSTWTTPAGLTSRQANGGQAMFDSNGPDAGSITATSTDSAASSLSCVAAAIALTAAGGAPFFIAFPRIKGLELDNPLSPVVGLQSTFLQPQVLPPIPVAGPATVPATVLVAVQKRAVRLRRPAIIVAPQTPTFAATQLVGRQKRPVKRPPPQLKVAPQTPTFAPTTQRAVQKRPVRAPRPQRLVPAPQTPTFPAIVLRGIKRSIPLLRVRPLVRAIFVPTPPPTFPAAILRGIRRLVKRQLRPQTTIGGQPKLPPPVGQASSPVGTPTQPTVGQQAPGPVGTPTQPGTGQSTPSVVGTPTQKQP